MSRNCELKMLIADEKCWILLEQEAQRYAVVCKTYEVGQHLLHFVNEDLSDMEWTGKIIQA